MKDYNGFTSKQRDKAQRWLNAQWSAGTLPRPTRCVACGQEHGVIDAHAEDYSEPFRAGVTDRFHLCFPCHMMVHCRHRGPAKWEAYREIIERGFQTHPFLRRDWPRFEKEFLRGPLTMELFVPAPVQIRKALHEIELSQDEVRERLHALGLAVARR
jgi:hypothetical protein